MITKYVKGDICDTELDYIAHGVNCQNKMGSGVARALYERYPEVKEEYHIMLDKELPLRVASSDLLGDYIIVESGAKTIFNCFTQDKYGYNGEKLVSYAAILECFGCLNLNLNQEKLAIPKIGCGLAGGDWTVVEALINEVTPDIEIWVYELS